jgi:hypothetical protein
MGQNTSGNARIAGPGRRIYDPNAQIHALRRMLLVSRRRIVDSTATQGVPTTTEAALVSLMHPPCTHSG